MFKRLFSKWRTPTSAKSVWVFSRHLITDLPGGNGKTYTYETDDKLFWSRESAMEWASIFTGMKDLEWRRCELKAYDNEKELLESHQSRVFHVSKRRYCCFVEHMEVF